MTYKYEQRIDFFLPSLDVCVIQFHHGTSPIRPRFCGLVICVPFLLGHTHIRL